MGPKTAKAPEKVVVKDDINVFYVEIKHNESIEKLTVNSSCRLDIIADFTRRHFLKYCVDKIAELTAANCEDETLLQTLKDYQSCLHKSSPADMIYQDNQGVNITCTEDTERSGTAVFTSLTTYKLGITKEDKTVFVMGQKPLKMKDKLSEKLNRYSRQMILPAIGAEGQEILSSSRVLVIGAGGIGSTVLMYLASSGIPLTVLDFDSVEISNLHRQVIHDTSNEGMKKTTSAISRLTAINPSLPYNQITEKLTAQNAETVIQQFDVVVDATDNFEARYIINDACVLRKKPLVSGSAVGLEGQATVFLPCESACYRCLYPTQSFAESCRSCANAGVLGPVPGLIGCLQAIETIKLLLLRGTKERPPSSSSAAQSQLECLVGRQILYDASVGSFHTFTLPSRSVDCAVCGDHPTILSLSDTERELQQTQCDNALKMSSIAPTLDAAYVKTAWEAKELLIGASCSGGADQNGQKVPVIILDVRSVVQFNLSSFIFSELVCGESGDNLKAFPSTSECLKHIDEHGRNDVTYLVNVPLDILRGGKGATATRDANKAQQLQQLRDLVNRMRPDATNKKVILLVLCRRGIDSVAATQLLLEDWQSHDVDIFNVRGGLTAWKSEVESDFPFY